jgi:short-subunit dehydrogenase
MIDTNLMGVINGVAAVLPSMLARGQGAIAVVASVAGYHGLPNALVYGATKAALINFCETLHLDLAPRGVDVFLINPGFVETPAHCAEPVPHAGIDQCGRGGEAHRRGPRSGPLRDSFPEALHSLAQAACVAALRSVVQGDPAPD